MHRDGRVQAGWRLPCTIPDGSHEFTVRPRGMQGYTATVTSYKVPCVRHALDLDLQPFYGRIHVAHSPTTTRFFTQDVPRFQCLTKFQVDAALIYRAK